MAQTVVPQAMQPKVHASAPHPARHKKRKAQPGLSAVANVARRPAPTKAY